MLKSTKLLFLAHVVFLCFFNINLLNAQMVGANAYIKGTSVEIGISGLGGFEGCPTGASPPLAGMHFRSGNPFFGFVSNPQVNAWATFDGDFFTPGSPENGWGIELPSGINYGNNCAYLQQINGAMTSWSQTFSCISADWQGDLTTGTNLHFKINYFLKQTDLFYTTTVSVTNNTAATIPTLYYYRNVDPDNNQPISGDFTTQNTIVSQPFSGLCNTAHVKATSSVPASQPMSYFGLAGTGANWRAFYGGFANRDGSNLWNGTAGFTQTVGSTLFIDGAIGLAYRINNLAPGATETFKFVCILDDAASPQAVANTTFLSYPGSATAPPAACTPYTDTVKICQGVPSSIGVSGPNIASYNWSWSPATGLSSTTGATVSANPAVTTTYTAIGTPINACFAAISFPFVVYVRPSAIVTPETNISVCAGAIVPVNTFLSTPAGATYTWTNSNAAIGLAISGATNTPTFTATNATSSPITSTITITPTLAGCVGPTSTYTITVNPIPVTTANSPTICPGAPATLTAAGAATYAWSTGATTNPISVTPAATSSYTVTGTSLGCTSSAVATVTVAPAMFITVNSPTICVGQTANLSAGGATTYTWSAGASSSGLNTADATPASTTTYTVTGTTAGCTGTAVATVTVNPLPLTTVNSPTICAGDIATLTAAGATTYSWSTGAITNPITDSPLTTTSYTVTGTSLGCTSTAVGTVTVNPLPVTTVNSPTICPTFTANLIASGATTYTWSAGATSTGVNSADATPATTTTYTVTGTSLGCTSTAVATVTVNSSLVVNAGLNDTVCFGQTTVLGVTPNGAGYTYNWTPAVSLTGPTTLNPIAAPAATTTYSVLVTDAAGCTGTSSVTVFADPQITIAIAAIDVTCNSACNGQTIVIPAGGTSTYLYNWSSGCVAASCSSLCIGTYTVTVTDTWGCTAMASTTVSEPSLLTAASPVTTSASCNGVCDGTATAAGSGGTIGAGYTYSWNTVPVQNTATASSLCAGTYTCTITDANACTTTTTATITEPTLVVIEPIAASTICFGGSTSLTAVATGGNPGAYSYTWSPAGTGTTATVSVSPVATTVYTVNASDANGCPAAAVNVTVTVNPPLTVVANGAVSICPGASASISALASLGGGGPYTYTWAPAGTGTPLSVSPAVTTTYTVTANDGCSPAATATVTITLLPLPTVVIAASATSGCEPLCITLINNTSLAAGTITSWIWNYGDGSPADTAHYHCYAAAGQYSVNLTVTTSDGCTSSLTNSNMITVHPTPVADFTAPLATSIVNSIVNYTDNSSVPTGSIATWQWNFGDVFATTDGTSSVQNPSHNFTEPGTYCATLTVTTNFGCIDATQLCIVIDPEFTFFIPNAFSPNGDGINDEFYGKGDHIKEFEMSIFDRWGNLIFFTDDINKHWDGKANYGLDIAQQDVYVYSVKIKDYKEKKHTYLGTVTIVK